MIRLFLNWVAVTWHWLAHLFGLNRSHLYRGYGDDGHEWLYLRCATCGKDRAMEQTVICNCPRCVAERSQ